MLMVLISCVRLISEGCLRTTLIMVPVEWRDYGDQIGPRGARVRAAISPVQDFACRILGAKMPCIRCYVLSNDLL